MLLFYVTKVPQALLALPVNEGLKPFKYHHLYSDISSYELNHPKAKIVSSQLYMVIMVVIYLNLCTFCSLYQKLSRPVEYFRTQCVTERTVT